MPGVNLPTNPAREREITDRRRKEATGGGHVPPPAPRRVSFVRRFVSGLIQLGLVVAVLFAGFETYRWFVDSAPTANRSKPKRVARLVEVVPVTPATTGPVIEAWGEVVAAQTLVVRPQVSGTIEWVDPEVTAGGRLSAGQDVARFDRVDLELALAEAETAISQIDARMAIEAGQAELGRLDLKRSSRNLTEEQRDLILRVPQRKQLEAEREAAVARRDQAKNMLERAVVAAPFDAIVVSEQVAPGAVVTQGTEVARLVASDRFHITLAIPASSLDWVRFDGSQMVEISQPGIWPEGTSREGRIIRLNAQLTETGRMAEVIVAVSDPLALKPENAGKPKLLLGSFVQGRITGEAVDGAVTLARANLRDDDTVWVMNGDDKLEVREVKVGWRGAEHVLVTAGLEEGDRVITSALATVTPGMALRTRDSERKGPRGDDGDSTSSAGEPESKTGGDPVASGVAPRMLPVVTVRRPGPTVAAENAADDPTSTTPASAAAPAADARETVPASSGTGDGT